MEQTSPDPCQVCGSPVRLEQIPLAPRKAGPQEFTTRRVCTNAECDTNDPGRARRLSGGEP